VLFRPPCPSLPLPSQGRPVLKNPTLPFPVPFAAVYSLIPVPRFVLRPQEASSFKSPPVTPPTRPSPNSTCPGSFTIYSVTTNYSPLCTVIPHSMFSSTFLTVLFFPLPLLALSQAFMLFARLPPSIFWDIFLKHHCSRGSFFHLKADASSRFSLDDMIFRTPSNPDLSPLLLS